ncbi:hypothetical protein A584_12920 [Pseudomonas syringae pv. theae ICMP 3923]|nr:hypothetical protein A584_12920 [Pseudomonas syringae pv. theae ICMP 3923]MBL3827776.1 hypothetical protein [Pseudomonas syringae pv. theae]NAS98526.1 hypothetical protein [Pseudomonas syringae pv. actinidifoliorum]MBL3833018.1 hypothetical protein [Pseudomonas syringae pv. theae]MBL3865599.1 hypothetical protein [Pseudomonas syringae pv. theae]
MPTSLADNLSFLEVIDRYPVKTAQSEGAQYVEGLSSGAGSALAFIHGRVLKFKRCGFRDIGFTHDCIGDESIPGDQSYAGLMGLDSAAVELMISQELWELGLLTAYKPLGLYVATEDFSDYHEGRRFGCTVFDITSDVRVDELLMMAITPTLMTRLAGKTVSFSSKRNLFSSLFNDETTNFCVGKKDAIEFVVSTAKASGAAYRRLHDAGYYRGRGSAWLGNDLLTPTGDIELVDFDGGMRPCSLQDVSNEKGIELDEYTASSTAYFSWGQAPLMAEMAYQYNKEFRYAYSSSVDAVVPMDLMSTMVKQSSMYAKEIQRVLINE